MHIAASRGAGLAALALLAACSARTEAPLQQGSSISRTAVPGVITRSPEAAAEAVLPGGDSIVDIAPSPFAPEAALLVRTRDGRVKVLRWSVGDASESLITELPSGFVPHAIAAHPSALRYFVSGAVGGRSRILAVRGDGGSWSTRVVFETPRQIGRLIVGPRPFGTDSGEAHRIFFAAKLPGGETSLRTITERGGIEYQVVGPASAAVKLARDDIEPGGLAAPTAVPMSVHPRGEPLYWQDGRGCTHAYGYSNVWERDSLLAAIPCDGWTTVAPNGNAFIHWRAGRAGVTVLGAGVTGTSQATAYTFAAAPVSVPDGRGIIGAVAKGDGRMAVVYAPIDVPLADVANAWQHAGSGCQMDLLTREGGAFREVKADQLYRVYDLYDYWTSTSVGTVGTPFLATTDLFWDNFGAAFNGVFIIAEQQRAIPAFWSFVDSANAALARTAPSSMWAKAFGAIAGSRDSGTTGEAALVARATAPARSAALDSVFDFSELKPRGHYTASAEMRQYFRAVHYLTEIGRVRDPAQLASLPAGVHKAAAAWIDVYRPFIAPPRAPLVWSGTAGAVAPFAKHPPEWRRVFPVGWGLDNEVLESTVYHDKWPPDEQIFGDSTRRLHPSGLDVASVYGNGYARELIGPDLVTYPRLAPVLDGLRARRPRVDESSSVYERWLDALGSEWADSTRFPGAPPNSRVWKTKRLQTALASWATLREATVLVNERAGAAEAGEGGFEELILEAPRGYVEPAPQTFRAIAGLYDALSRTVAASSGIEANLRGGIVSHLDSSAAEARWFGAIAERELRGQALSDSDYAVIQRVGGSAEHAYLIYKSLGTKDGDEGLPNPEPMAKIADVAGDLQLGVLEAAVGNPLEWRQLVPFFGRREIVIGGVYSYHEFVSKKLYDNAEWRNEVGTHPHPAWVQPLIATPGLQCSVAAAP